MNITKISSLCVVAAAALTACGGGGGSSGETQAAYSIALRVEKNTLPVNLSAYAPGIGVNAPYTTTLYVNGTTDGRPIPGGENVFSCNIDSGLETGSLYYLDGKDEHTVEVDDGQGGKIKVPASYRGVTLGANSGGNSFHFHSGNRAGTATITCSIQDPRDKKSYSASVSITVGGATGKPASIRTIAQNPVLGTQGNQINVSTSVAINAQLLDDANQTIPNSGKPNLQVVIVPGGASSGARLLSGNKDGNSVQVSTNDGIALFSLASGSREGNIILEMTADRFDNDVSNGIQDPIRQVTVVPVIQQYVGPAPVPLEPIETSLPPAINGVPYSYAFSVKGGTAPYTWTALGQLPAGLNLSPAGLLAGTPKMERPGPVQIAIQVIDAGGQTLISNVTLTVAATLEGDPELGYQALKVEESTPPALFNNQPYNYALAAKGGLAPYRWEALGELPTGLRLSADGVLSGTPMVLRPGAFPIAVRLTDSRNQTIAQNITLSIAATPGGDTEQEPLVFLDVTPPAATNGLPYSYSLRASGGDGPYTWEALGGLPTGMALSSVGLLSGIPTVERPGKFSISVRLTDNKRRTVTNNLILDVQNTPAIDPEAGGGSGNLNIIGCDVADLNAGACQLPVAKPSEDYSYTFTSSATGVEWIFTSPPSWAQTGTIGGNGYLAGKPRGNKYISSSCGPHEFFVTAKKGSSTVVRKFSINVQGNGYDNDTCP